MRYCPDLLTYHRRRTRVVLVGDVAVGGDNPIRVQSMTTTQTKDVGATAAQVERLVDAGCEIVRITTPTPDDARRLADIRALLRSRSVRVPLVADIHFSPLAAMVAADYADKVRINPGNYVDSRRFAVREYTDSQYREEVERMAERFSPLVLKCKEQGIAMRIGTNHGSLSDRIMNRFGDTPEGMVESALEFVHVCESHGYRDIILSMKASNPKVMIAAYRRLAARMAELDMDYPFHLGVTEAGNGHDGRIKSAVGIGALLEDGIGDTIRVSLTEEPEAEIPVAQEIARRYPKSSSSELWQSIGPGAGIRPSWDPFHYSRRHSEIVAIGDTRAGGSETLTVIGAADTAQTGVGNFSESPLLPALLRWASPAGRRRPKPEAVTVDLVSERDVDVFNQAAERLSSLPGARLALIAAAWDWRLLQAVTDHCAAVMLRLPPGSDQPVDSEQIRPLLRLMGETGTPLIISAHAANEVTSAGNHLSLERAPRSGGQIEARGIEVAVDQLLAFTERASQQCQVMVSIRSGAESTISAYRLLTSRLARSDLDPPILLDVEAAPEEASDHLLVPSIQLGSLLCDGIGDAVLIRGAADTSRLAFDILQASGARISKTDYVACPSCGRTLFDLEETTDRIKSRTAHLSGVKLAIMGCIVNGPGEMADADFGYVGGAPGRVNLYVGKECVEKGVPVREADDRLIALIKSRGKWVEDVDGDDAGDGLHAK